jgi:hypothetical protein
MDVASIKENTGEQFSTAFRCKYLLLQWISNDGEQGRTQYWRKGWDSNPRYPCRYAGFQDRCLKPLGHPSFFGCQRLSRGVRPGKASNRVRWRSGSIERSGPALAECKRQQTGAQQHEACRGQCEESVGDQIVVAHDTPATLDARPNLLKLSESPASKEVMRLSAFCLGLAPQAGPKTQARER